MHIIWIHFICVPIGRSIQTLNGDTPESLTEKVHCLKNVCFKQLEGYMHREVQYY